jgi:putative membrane protein
VADAVDRAGEPAVDSASPGVDARFSLANERTLLAWVRTALALLAAAGAVQQFADLHGRDVLAVLLAVAGVMTAAAGGWRYRRTTLALARNESLGAGWAPTALAAAVVVVGVILLVAVLLTL